jgi:hypothetical protein
MSLPEL